MRNFREELIQLKAEPCSCIESEYCPDDNVTYPPIQCERCGDIECIEYHLRELEYLAELEARERFEEDCEVNMDYEMAKWFEQEGC